MTDNNVRPSAPLGIKALCILFALGGLFLIFSGLTMGIVGVVFFALGVAELLMVYGLWTVKPWGWMMAMVLLSLGALVNLLNVFNLLNTAAAGNPGAMVGFVFTVGILIYIYQKRGLYMAD